MQPTIGPKRAAITQPWATVLALGIVLGSAFGLAGLAATGHLPWAAASPSQESASMQTPATLHAALFEAKLDQLDAIERHGVEAVARAASREKLLRFNLHKEEQLLALSTQGLAVIYQQTSLGLDRADAIAAFRATTRMDAASGWALTPDGCSCPPAESWTLLDDLTPVRVWR